MNKEKEDGTAAPRTVVKKGSKGSVGFGGEGGGLDTQHVIKLIEEKK